jgi:hypothetical protein
MERDLRKLTLDRMLEVGNVQFYERDVDYDKLMEWEEDMTIDIELDWNLKREQELSDMIHDLTIDILKGVYTMNNLQALERLKTSAKEQSKELSNTITEIHKQNSKDLLENLKATHERRSKNLEQSIQVLEQELKKNTDKLAMNLTEIHKNKLRNIEEMISEKLENGNKWKMILLIFLTFILTIFLTLGIVYLTMTKQYNQQNQTTFYFYKIEHNKGQ